MSNGDGRFKLGQRPPPGAGRPLGSTNKRTLELQATLQRHGFDVGKSWMEIIAKANEAFDNAPPEEAAKYLKIVADVTGNIADRIYPRLKSIEHKQFNNYDGMTPEQKLEMLKATTKALEDEIVRSRSGLIRDVGSDPSDEKP